MSERMLLVDTYDFSYSLPELIESEGQQWLEVEGRIQHADLQNANGRIYPRSLWEKVLADPNIVENINEGAMLGELDHPDDGKTSLKRVSHIMRKVWMKEDGEVMGRIRILNNAQGQQLKEIINAGGKVGISSRGSGSVKPMNGVQVVQEDFKLNTWDFVVTPSTPNAFPKAVGAETKKAARLYKEEKQEESMDSIKKLTSLKESVAELVEKSKDAVSTRVKKQVANELMEVEIELNKLMLENKAVATVAEPIREKAAAARELLEGGEFRPNLSMTCTHCGTEGGFNTPKDIVNQGWVADPLSKSGGTVCSNCADKFKVKPAVKGVAEAEDNDPDRDFRGEKDGKKDKGPDSDKDDNEGCDCSGDDCKCDPKKQASAKTDEGADASGVENVEDILQQMESTESPVNEQIADLTSQRDAAIRQARVTYRISEATSQASGLVMNALRERIKQILAQQASAPVAEAEDVDGLREENEKLKERNERLESFINKLQAKMNTAVAESILTKPAAKTVSIQEDALPAAGTTKTITESKSVSKSAGASLASRALNLMQKTKATRIERGGQIFEDTRSSVR